MYIVSVISISDRNSAQCEGEDVSSQWAFPILRFPSWYVTLAKIEKFRVRDFVTSSESPGLKRRKISGFTIPLDVPTINEFTYEMMVKFIDLKLIRIQLQIFSVRENVLHIQSNNHPFFAVSLLQAIRLLCCCCSVATIRRCCDSRRLMMRTAELWGQGGLRSAKPARLLVSKMEIFRTFKTSSSWYTTSTE